MGKIHYPKSGGLCIAGGGDDSGVSLGMPRDFSLPQDRVTRCRGFDAPGKSAYPCATSAIRRHGHTDSAPQRLMQRCPPNVAMLKGQSPPLQPRRRRGTSREALMAFPTSARLPVVLYYIAKGEQI